MKNMNIEDKIIYKVPYIDTLQIWLQTPLENQEFGKIESLCKGKSMYPYNNGMKFHKKWKSRIILQIPSDEAFDYLIKICRENILINKIHLALDLTTKDISDAEDIKKYLDHHQVHPWHGKQKVCRIENTTYTAARSARRNIVKYADRRSKITGTPCCHIEMRLLHVDTLRNAGFSDIQSLKDLNHYDFWSKNLRLREINVEKFGKELLNRQQRKKPWIKKFGNGLQYDIFRRAGYTAIRFSTYSEEPATVQEVIDRFRGTRINVSKCLKKINTGPFLPPPKTYDYTYMVI